MALNQSNRLIRMTKGPLGPDEVVVTSFTGREAISRPFSFDIEFISTQARSQAARHHRRRRSRSRSIAAIGPRSRSRPGTFTAMSAGSRPATWC